MSNYLIIDGDTIVVRTTRTVLERVAIWNFTTEKNYKDFNNIIPELNIQEYNFIAKIKDGKINSYLPMYFKN